MRYQSSSESSEYSDSDAGDQPTRLPPPIHSASKSKEPANPVGETQLGSLSETREIYLQRPYDIEKWVDKCPSNYGNAVENKRTAKSAIVLRQQESKDPRRKLTAHSIVIQSPWLQRALHEHVFNDYPGVLPEMGRLVIPVPFKPFVHRWSKFEQLSTRTDLDQTTKEHVQLLYDTMKQELGGPLAAYQTYLETRMISFQDLWMIFEPGKVVVTGGKGSTVASEVRQITHEKNPLEEYWKIRHLHVDWDGHDFRYIDDTTKISEYNERRAFDDLSICPLDLQVEKERITGELVERGAKFEQLRGYQYKVYNGPAISRSGGSQGKVHIAERIIIDAVSYDRHCSGQSRKFRSLDGFAMVSNDDPMNQEVASRRSLSEYHKMLCTDRVRGYSPKLHSWIQFFVDHVSDIHWQPKALENLVISRPQKELIRAIARSKRENNKSRDFDDFIKGKGQGLVILLSGMPGCGKTLTAEAVAEDMKAPLMVITFANLGSEVYSIERQLSSILALAGHWNAVLLLDECDVFLEARSPDRLEQNNMVSIFLRTLEYYKGLLFMTTNRRDNIDEAFASRIHLSFEYPKLNYESRFLVWKNLLEASRESHSLSDQDIRDLAHLEINGRQIKNMLKVAHLFATDSGQRLNRKFLDTVRTVENRPLPPALVDTASSAVSSPTEPPSKRKANREMQEGDMEHGNGLLKKPRLDC